MALQQRLDLKQTQQLVMTPQLQMAIRLLQMTGQELSAAVAEEVERNPLLRMENGEGEAPTPEKPRRETAEEVMDTPREALFEAPLAAFRAPVGAPAEPMADFTERMSTAPTLREHLLPQIATTAGGAPEKMLASLLVDELDEAGYLRADLDLLAERLGADDGLVERAVEILQGCEPAGIGARDLGECLALQLRERNRMDPAMAALLERLEDLAALRLDALSAACGVDREDIAEMIAEIRRLDPRPGSAFDAPVAQAIVPDVFVRRNNLGGWSVEVNTEALPRVLVDKTYAAELSATGAVEATNFVAECERDAGFLLRALDQRAQTILKVTTEIVKQQHMFLEQGVSALRPMTLKMVADEIGMHESTVSRVTSNKYLATESGLFELKYFFTKAIAAEGEGDSHSSEAVRHQIKTLIAQEDSRKTLSDDQIVKMLRDDGVNIARRTVAKYRESMNIPSSVQRRRLKAAALN